MANATYRYRELARVEIEALTPLRVGSGIPDTNTKAPVVRDVNGLPYIPGTSLCGVLRRAFGEETDLFGGDQAGSRLFITDGIIIGADGKAADGLLDSKDAFLIRFEQDLPIRQHVRITGKGTHLDKGLFNEQVIFKGTRFVFELETESDEKVEELKSVLSIMTGASFSIGGGKNDGFGKIKVVSTKYCAIDLCDAAQLDAYVSKGASLSSDWSEWDEIILEQAASAGLKQYELHLRPVDTFFFGAGKGDKDSNMTTVKEYVVEWKDGKGSFSERPKALIPGTSVKGAISHRTAYHFNKEHGIFADDLSDSDLNDTENYNEAVIALFGTELDDRGLTAKNGIMGKVTVSDVMLEECQGKVLNHAVLDSFTGGTQAGKLFSEEVSMSKQEFVIEVSVNTVGLKEEYLKYLEDSLQDICDGLLPLGGGVNRGNGIFEGKLTIV